MNNIYTTKHKIIKQIIVESCSSYLKFNDVNYKKYNLIEFDSFKSLVGRAY